MTNCKSIDSSALFKVALGYDADGGLYDSFEQVLKEKGWTYSIAIDAWVPPSTERLTLSSPINITAEAVEIFKRGNAKLAEINAKYETRHGG